MAKKNTTDFSVGVSAKSTDEVIDKEVLKKAKKFVKDLEELGVEVLAAFVSSGHIRGGSVDLATENEAKTDADKE